MDLIEQSLKLRDFKELANIYLAKFKKSNINKMSLTDDDKAMFFKRK
jgi:hypothetical protein